MQFGEPASGAPRVLNSGPAEAVLSLEMTVLLMKFTTRESTSDTPAPSQPATLLVMMLLVTVAEYHCAGVLGKLTTSVPFIPWRRMPPPLPASAPLPITRLALITRPGPVPSLNPGGAQSRSVRAPQVGSTSGAPMMSRPPPLVEMVGLVLWLK